MTSKRVFSHNSDINFNDYIKNKTGVEIIKNIRSKSYHTVSRFVSYNLFILITKTYYKYIKNNNIEVPLNIYNSNTSFLVYKTLLSHMKDCCNCKCNKDILKLYDCKAVEGILYPYGKYIENNISNNIFLHNRINLDNFCIPCNNTELETTSISDNTDSSKNTHLYPSQNNFIIESIRDNNTYEQIQRMNAYAVYPNIHHCTNLTINNSCNSCKYSGLCKETKPLFI